MWERERHGRAWHGTLAKLQNFLPLSLRGCVEELCAFLWLKSTALILNQFILKRFKINEEERTKRTAVRHMVETGATASHNYCCGTWPAPTLERGYLTQIASVIYIRWHKWIVWKKYNLFKSLQENLLRGGKKAEMEK